MQCVIKNSTTNRLQMPGWLGCKVSHYYMSLTVLPCEQACLLYHGKAHSAWTAPLQSCETSCTEDRWSPETQNWRRHLQLFSHTCRFGGGGVGDLQQVYITSEVWSWFRSVLGVLGCSDSAFWEPPFPGVWGKYKRLDLSEHMVWTNGVLFTHKDHFRQ